MINFIFDHDTFDQGTSRGISAMIIPQVGILEVTPDLIRFAKNVIPGLCPNKATQCKESFIMLNCWM
ncbi:MAG: hypothetical protein IPN86_18095 [Saprospiraceae bacterium]|nr:hypothetical protein [Saprospiraceae bacterium]